MLRVIVTSAMAALILSGCVSTRSQHGYVVEFGETGLDALPGIDSKESILARFGEPSVRPPMNDDTWYYITQRTNARAFFQTQVYERDVVAFQFDGDGMVAEVARLDLADGTNIDIIGRTTATRGRELSLLQQLLGGVGQAAGGPVSTAATGGGPQQ
ncbi:MAG: outer membrane protein assembly factor BamE [Parvularculaceae bacterium]|nr:outer membrane protein assembly factor BamE [Parvularculaceae bacterium]